MATACPRCGNPLDRVHRSLAGRLFLRRVLRCNSCGFQLRKWRTPMAATRTFVFSRHTRCVQCGNPRVRRLQTRDRIDRMSRHPVSVLFGLFRAPIYYCNPCRLQYRDLRPMDSGSRLRE
jgi:hypothetical protein